MTIASHLVTGEELLAMSDNGPCELIAGEVAMMTPAGSEHGAIASRIFLLLGSHAATKRQGRVMSAETGFLIARDPDTVRVPDLAFVRRDRQADSHKGYFPGPPDLAVEVVSPTDRATDVEAKAQALLDAGTAVVWIVWPETRSVTVHRAGQPPHILHEQDAITGEEVLPGFQCLVAEFFRD